MYNTKRIKYRISFILGFLFIGNCLIAQEEEKETEPRDTPGRIVVPESVLKKNERISRRQRMIMKKERVDEILRKITPPKKYFTPKRIPFDRDRVYENLKFLDSKMVNYGMYLGGGGYTYNLSPNTEGVSKPFASTTYQVGYRIGIVFNFRVSDNWSILFEPGVLFTSRKIDFRPQYDSDIVVFDQNGYTREFSASYLNLPLFFTYRGQRINNIRGFVKFSPVSLLRNFSSFEGDENRDNLKTKEFNTTKNSYGMELAIGFDYYSSYYKVSPSIGFGIGFADEYISDDTAYTRMMTGLYNKGFYIQVNIEQGE